MTNRDVRDPATALDPGDYGLLPIAYVHPMKWSDTRQSRNLKSRFSIYRTLTVHMQHGPDKGTSGLCCVPYIQRVPARESDRPSQKLCTL